MRKLSEVQQSAILTLSRGGWVAKNTLDSLIRRGLAESESTGQVVLTGAGLDAWWDISTGPYNYETA